MGKWCLHASLFLDNKDMFKNYKRFDFWHVQTADIEGTKPWKHNWPYANELIAPPFEFVRGYLTITITVTKSRICLSEVFTLFDWSMHILTDRLRQVNCSLIWKLFKFLITVLAGLFIKVAGTRTGIKARSSSGLWFPWPIYMFFLNEIWPWHIGLRWAILALWATCYCCLGDVRTSANTCT